MSAFICNYTHIATCAKIIAETVPGAGNRTVAEIAGTLALENVLSVTARYGGRAASMLPSDADGSAVIFVDRCKVAPPLECSAAEGHAYLACLAYQSCEHPEWPDSTARAWMAAANNALSMQMRDELLDGSRHIREIGGEALHSEEPRLCPPVHIATGVYVLRSAGLYVLSAVKERDISDALATASFEKFKAEGGLKGVPTARRRKLLEGYKRECATTMPARTRPVEAHALLNEMHDMCADQRGVDLESPASMWLEHALDDNADNMRDVLLEGRHVWEAPHRPSAPEALPTP